MKLNCAPSDDDANMSDSDDDSMSTYSEDGEKVPMLPTSVCRPPRTTPAKFLQPEKATINDVIESMSSYDDLRFLVANIEKQKLRRSKIWQVAPPHHWNTNRRGGFFNWTTGTLAFTFRGGGAGVAYVQISETRGGKLLDLLKSTIRACMERGLGNGSPAAVQTMPREFTFSPHVQVPNESISTPSYE
jgi:hypothetical protein